MYIHLYLYGSRHPEFISGSHFIMLIYNHYEIPSQAENDVNYRLMSFYGRTKIILMQPFKMANRLARYPINYRQLQMHLLHQLAVY